jgi:UDP-glucose 4-epimerase
VKIESKRVVVTGGAGFIGSHLVDALIAKDNDVVIVDDFSTGVEENVGHHLGNPHVRIVRADVRDLEAMIEATRGADLVFHLAVACLRVSLYDPQSVHEINATGTLNVCRAALKNMVQRLVYVSSSESYGTAEHAPMAEDHPLNPTTVYGASKLAGEAYTRSFWSTYGLPAIVVRPFNTYGPREHSRGASAEVIPRFVLRTMAGQPSVIFGDGSQTRDFTWVLDTARGILQAAECDALIGECVNIACGEEVSILELCNIILEALGRQDLQPLYVREGRPGDVQRHFADIGRAKRLFAFRPTVGIHAGVERYIEWVRGQNVDLEQWASEEHIVNWVGQ